MQGVGTSLASLRIFIGVYIYDQVSSVGLCVLLCEARDEVCHGDFGHGQTVLTAERAIGLIYGLGVVGQLVVLAEHKVKLIGRVAFVLFGICLVFLENADA